MTPWFLALALFSTDATPDARERAPATSGSTSGTETGEVQLGVFALDAGGRQGTGSFVGAGVKTGPRHWLDFDVANASSSGVESRETYHSVSARLRWENAGGSISAGIRWLRIRRHGCYEVDGEDGRTDCEGSDESLPAPSLDWRAGRIEGLHLTGGVLGGARSNPTLGALRLGVGHPVGGIRLEAGVDTTAGGYLSADLPFEGRAGAIRVTAGVHPDGVMGGLQLLVSFD